MANKLVIVESPAKAKTIGKFLGRDHSTVAFAEKRMREVFTYPSIYKDEIKLYNKFVESL